MFEVIKGKNGKNDRYFNPDHIQSFYIYRSTEGVRTLSIRIFNRIENFLETYYEIDDFVDRIKGRIQS